MPVKFTSQEPLVRDFVKSFWKSKYTVSAGLPLSTSLLTLSMNSRSSGRQDLWSGSLSLTCLCEYKNGERIPMCDALNLGAKTGRGECHSEIFQRALEIQDWFSVALSHLRDACEISKSRLLVVFWRHSVSMRELWELLLLGSVFPECVFRFYGLRWPDLKKNKYWLLIWRLFWRLWFHRCFCEPL